MFQRSMSARPPPEPQPQPDFVNRLLRTNFDIMNDLGDSVNRPFLQVRKDGLYFEEEEEEEKSVNCLQIGR